ncbi:carbonic anhydrase [Trichoderma parareesei]|uniref:Carbonic anhydrase n=1 Tax=Trichoderma parareesei TaxID=858221 RepID=A0A2H2YYH6_TRIPA|nr:carbonic anhydrase [Trichoderma parareesei]
MLPSRIGRQSLRLAAFRSSSARSSSLTFSPALRPVTAGNRYCSSSSSSSSNNNNNNNSTTSDSVSGTISGTNAKTPARLPGMPEHDHDVERYLRENHQRLFENNRKWAAERLKQDPEFFTRLSAGQSPEYLWIGCSDSRIPAEAITGLGAGEAFVHRNIANMVISTDLNVMSVINYAVRHLKVKHIVVCGHYGCGGVKAAMTPKDMGLLNPWLRNIRDVYRLHEKELDAIADEKQRYDRLVELNVFEQCRNVIKTADVQYSFEHNRYPIVHGWVFGFEDGLIKDLNIDMRKILADIQKIYNLTDE